MVKRFAASLKNEFRGYNAAKFLKDLMAGLTVCAVALPLALAFGVSSGATAAAGMVTAIIAGIVIGFFSGASFQISGPTGAMSAVLIAIVVQYGIQGMFVACFISGFILLICGVLKLGKLIGFIPSSVVMGFTSGIAVVIALGQIDNFFGTHSEGLSTIDKLFSYTKLGFSPDLSSVILGLTVVAIMIIWPKKWNATVPSSLIGIVIATVISVISGMDVERVGQIPKTLLLDDRLDLGSLNLDMLGGLISPIITIAALAMIESLMCGASASGMKHENFDADAELVAQGIGNMIIPFFGGVPATAAIARTSVAIKSGQQTRLTGIFHSVFLLASMFLLGGVMAKIPLSALAGVLMVTAWRMNEWKGIKFIFSHKFSSAISQFLITMIATVVLDLMWAIIIGVLYSAILFMVSSSKLTVEHSEFTPSVGSHSNVVTVTGSLFFGAVHDFKHSFEGLRECEHLLISINGVTNIDVSGASAFAEVCQEFAERNVTVSVCGVRDNVMKILQRAGADSLINGHVYASADDAFEALMTTVS